MSNPAGGDAVEADPGYAHLAVSDPSADATSTQTWAAIEDTGGWRSEQSRRRTATHADHATYPGARGQSLRALGPAPESGRRPRSVPGDDWAEPRAQADGLDGVARPGTGPTDAEQPAAPSRRPARRGQPSTTAGRGTAEGAGGGPAAGARRASRAGGQTSRARRTTVPAGRSNKLLLALLGAPVAVVIVVVTAYVALQSGSTLTTRAARPSASRSASNPAASLGPWRHIATRADDPQPLTLTELFPAQFSSAGVSGTRTVEKSDTKCTRDVVGGKLRSAVRKAACTQAMRASYLSSDRKMMATVGVLNLLSATDAQTVGKASGASEFISQLPGPRGPTKQLTQGTGLEEAVVKGHYLILIWAEFANLSAPSGKHQRAELEQFSSALITGTVNASLSSRMVTGQPVAAS